MVSLTLPRETGVSDVGKTELVRLTLVTFVTETNVGNVSGIDFDETDVGD